MSWTELMDGTEPAVRDAPLDRARFGRSFERAVVPEGADREAGLAWLAATIAESTADLVVARYPARYVDWFAALGSGERDLLFADTLVYWRAPLDPVPGGLVAPADPAVEIEDRLDPAVVAELVTEGFADYPSHYRANPLLAAEDIRAGYVEWASSVADAGDGFGLRHREHGVVGFAVQQPGGDHAEVLLAAVRPQVQGAGLYRHLFAACAERARERGLGSLVTSTQAHNLGGQRAWARFGLEPVGAFTTVHAVRPGLLR